MAIHVKPVYPARRQLLRNLRRALAIAAGLTLLTIIISAIILYLHLIFIEKESSAAFTYVYPQEQQPQPEKKPEPAFGGGGSAQEAAAANITPDIIVSTTASTDSQLQPMDFDLADGLAMTDADGFDFGLGLSGDGSGAGDGGNGNGEGSGQGGGRGDGQGKGSGGGSGGYNDDIQVVLALDASGSMDSLFAAVASSLSDVLTILGNARLNGKPTKVNVGIVVYGQAAKEGKPFILSRFTTNVNKLLNKVTQTACDGAIEPCGEAIQLASRKFPWNMRKRDDMLKVIFICGNEPFDMGKVDYKSAILLAKAKNIIINTVHCGGSDPQWEAAAHLGNGKGLTFNALYTAEPQQAPKAPKDREKLRHQVLTALYHIPMYPIGSPAVQRQLLSAHKPTSAPPKNPKQLSQWMMAHRTALIDGFEWDAAELCRRTGIEQFTLEHIGGRGNLPLSLRGKSDTQALQAIRKAAQERETQLARYRDSNLNDFAEQILETLQEQAQSKGITIEL